MPVEGRIILTARNDATDGLGWKALLMFDAISPSGPTRRNGYAEAHPNRRAPSVDWGWDYAAT